MSREPFRGAVALVTGAASGIGRALTVELAGRGAIVELGDLDPARVDGIGTDFVQELDVTDAAAVRAWVERAVTRHGRIDYAFHNAGIAIGGEAQELSLDDWARVIDVNLRGVVHGVHAVYPIMIRQGFGHIVNVASVAGLVPYPFALPYTASKHAVVGLSSALRAEAAAYGIDVSVVCPGAVRTAIWERSEVRGWDRARAQLDLERRIVRWMSADDCAQAILRGVAQRRGLIVVTAEARVATMLQRLSPAVAVRASQWVADRLRRSRRLAR